MKQALLFLVCLLAGSSCFSQDNLIAGCCTSAKEARCTGSPYCSACTNCSRCAHCGAGGTCGVCSSRSGSNTRTTPRTSTGRKNNSTREYGGSRTRSIETATDADGSARCEVIPETLNLRTGPGGNFRVIAKLPKGTELIRLGSKGDWLKVRVAGSNKTGYVLGKYVL